MEPRAREHLHPFKPMQSKCPKMGQSADNYEESLQPIAAASANATSTLKQTMTDMKAAEAHRTESAEWI